MTDPEPRDLWTNSGGLRERPSGRLPGANRQPDPPPPRVRRQYGKVNRHSTGDPLKFLEYSLVGEDLVRAPENSQDPPPPPPKDL